MLELLSHQFIQNALIAGTLIAIICSIVGYFVIVRAQAYAAESLSHVGFTGATGAAVFGLSTIVGTFLFTVLVALGFGTLGNRFKGQDIEVGMVSSFGFGLGVLFLKLYTSNATEAVGILFGSILTVTNGDLYLSFVTGIVVLGILAFIFRPLLFASIDPDLAEARGVPVQLLGILFTVLVGLTVAEAILVVGVLLVFALLIAPAATAQHITNRPLTAVLASILLGIFFTWGGMFLGIIFHVPLSFFIATLAALSYLVAVPLFHIVSPHFYNPLPHQGKELLQ